jgi:Tol biopolymer transport system component
VLQERAVLCEKAPKKAAAISLGSTGMKVFRLLTLLPLLMVLSSCGGGSGSSSSSTGNGGGGGGKDPEAVVFRLGSTAIGQYGLFLGASTGGPMADLSPMTNTNGSVDGQYQLSPDKKWVAYLADAETDGLFELYVSSLDGSVIAQKLSPTANQNTRTIDNIIWSPDSTQVAYVADQDIAGTWELYVSTINGAIGVKVSADPLSGRESNTDVIRRGDTDDNSSDVVQWAPDGSRLAYIADLDENQVFELFTTTPDGNTNVVKISDSGIHFSTSNIGVPWKNKRESLAWSRDSSKIAYRLRTESLDGTHLYIADPAVGNGKLVSNEQVEEFAWAPDSTRIAYTEFAAPWIKDLYTVQRDGQNKIKVSGTFAADDYTHSFSYFSWAPDSSHLAYGANQNAKEKFELFVTLPDTEGDESLVSGVTSYGGLQSMADWRKFSWSPDGNYIAYISEQQNKDILELYASKVDGSSNVKLSGPMSDAYGVAKFAWSPDSSRIAYIADQNSFKVTELFASPIAGARETTDGDGGGPASNPRLNPDLVAGGIVDIDYLQWSEDSQRVFYYAYQEADNQMEFYSSTRDGSANNVQISASEALSFANYLYPMLSAANCSSCHDSGSDALWYADNPSDTYYNMSAEGYFDNNFIVDKLNGTLSHGGGTNASLASEFSLWIVYGVNYVPSK